MATTKRTQPKSKTSKQDDYNELARMISGVLNHPLTPAGVYMALADSISNLTHTDSMDAPQTIGCILYHDAMRQKASKCSSGESGLVAAKYHVSRTYYAAHLQHNK